MKINDPDHDVWWQDSYPYLITNEPGLNVDGWSANGMDSDEGTFNKMTSADHVVSIKWLTLGAGVISNGSLVLLTLLVLICALYVRILRKGRGKE